MTKHRHLHRVVMWRKETTQLDILMGLKQGALLLLLLVILVARKRHLIKDGRKRGHRHQSSKKKKKIEAYLRPITPDLTKM